jgi:hypothetical protein
MILTEEILRSYIDVNLAPFGKDENFTYNIHKYNVRNNVACVQISYAERGNTKLLDIYIDCKILMYQTKIVARII